MMLPRRTCEIWLWTTPSMPLSPKPCWRASVKAASRFGPWMPLVPARASVWQEPHFWHEQRLAVHEVGLVAAAWPQPPTSASHERRPAARAPESCPATEPRAGRLSARRTPGRSSRRGLRKRRRAGPGRPRSRRSRHALPAEALAARRPPAPRRARSALGGVEREPVHELVRDLLDRLRPTSNDSSGCSAGSSAGASAAVTSASPEWAADSGSAPQAAASAATMPNASGNVLGTTCASQAGSRSGRSSCSRRPVKCTRVGGLRAAAA